MTNKNYFKSLCGQRLYIGSFFLEFDKFQVHSNFLTSICNGKSSIFDFKVYSIENSSLLFIGSIIVTPRCIHTQLTYFNPELCKISPWELNEWCPAVFLPWTNYLHWRKYLKVALEIYVESNPKLLQK